MSQSIIHTHSYQHFEDLQLSANAFYTTLEKMITEYQYPKVKCRRETLKEGGMFSSKREYLEISKDDNHYFVCASPFGKSFFISWWLKEQEDAMAASVSKIPLVGKFLSGTHRGKSFYERDSELMFTQSIDAIIKTLVAKLAADKGFRTPDIIGTSGN